MPDTSASAAPAVVPVNVAPSAVEQQIKAQIRIVLAAIAGALIGKHLLPAGLINDTLLDALAALVMMAFASGWQWARVKLQHSRLWALAINPRVPNDLVRVAGAAADPPEPVTPPPIPVQPRRVPMSIGSTLKHVLGFVAGILIPGASESTTNLTHSVQQEMAKLYGAAAAKMAAELKVDTTGMSGPDKVFAITKALVATAVRDGFKGDVKVLGDVLLDVAQSAYRSIEPNIESEIVALATALTANPLVLVAAELVGSAAQNAADAHAPTALAA